MHTEYYNKTFRKLSFSNLFKADLCPKVLQSTLEIKKKHCYAIWIFSLKMLNIRWTVLVNSELFSYQTDILLSQNKYRSKTIFSTISNFYWTKFVEKTNTVVKNG